MFANQRQKYSKCRHFFVYFTIKIVVCACGPWFGSAILYSPTREKHYTIEMVVYGCGPWFGSHTTVAASSGQLSFSSAIDWEHRLRSSSELPEASFCKLEFPRTAKQRSKDDFGSRGWLVTLARKGHIEIVRAVWNAFFNALPVRGQVFRSNHNDIFETTELSLSVVCEFCTSRR